MSTMGDVTEPWSIFSLGTLSVTSSLLSLEAGGTLPCHDIVGRLS